MLLKLSNLLNRAQLDKINELLEEAEFADGKFTAGMSAKRVSRSHSA